MVNEVKSGIVPTLNQVEQLLDVVPPHPGAHSHIISQYVALLHTTSGTLANDEELRSPGVTDQLSSAQGLPQDSPSFPLTRFLCQPLIWNKKLLSIKSSMHWACTRISRARIYS